VRLVLGTIPLLVIAGVVEAFVSPTALPARIKFMLAGGLATLLVLYLARRPSAATEDDQIRQVSSTLAARI
jgi:hypothetical protein